ncbi:ParB/RepB/Spo0J family partition protein [Pelotomaculum propionicicum]|uniref:Putative chromosome-partitioning protein ParB n=1 Tax=Pelotomaculum propionicicum TaxID=258475 RepID=A0A4Y7RUG8_9FIRM|nr:ParB/RepB/Spo0J family partition protein [Pelotomaculum propionicicum]NLI14584.1 ParB/RepB/Spo0J family partition protein [Peptococcaceae bacterium]TEB12396.1 putative chromosome-partitioning protein ParB [Pelotomaculum propionicicum]
MYMDIPIEKIFTPDNVRLTYNQGAIRGLANSISQVGLLQPVIVKDNGDDTFTLLVGHRRFLAAKLAEVKSIRAIIFDDQESKIMLQLIENIQRENLNPIEEALAYKKVLEEEVITLEELAAKLGKPQSSIANAIRLLKLPYGIQKMLISGDLKQGHGKVLLQLKDPELQAELASKAVTEKMSVNALREAVLLANKTGAALDGNQLDDLLEEIRELRRSAESKYLSGNEQMPQEVKSKIRHEIEGFMKLLE